MYIRKDLNRNSPRFRSTSIGLLNRTTFNKFKLKYPQFKDCEEEVLKSIVLEYNRSLWRAALENRDGVELPEGLGNIFIGSCKPAIKENRDHIVSEKLGQTVIRRNLNSDSYLAKIFYTNYETKYRFKYRNLWMFKGAREFTTTTSKVYKVDWPKYIVVENYKKISNFFKKTKKKDYVKKIHP